VLLVVGGASIGFVLFYLSNLFGYSLQNCGACFVYGYPYFWHVHAVNGGLVIVEPFFGLDILFWIVVGLSAVLSSYWIAAHSARPSVQ
jgi:hypothetical protein